MFSKCNLHLSILPNCGVLLSLNDVVMEIQEVVVDTLMEFVKVGNAGKFHSSIYHKLIYSMVSLLLPFNLFIDLFMYTHRFSVIVVIS